MTIDELIARAKEASENQCMSDLCRENFKQLAEWLEELKQYREQYKEQNQETNLDHFKHEIIDIEDFTFAVRNGKVVPCEDCKCSECFLDDPNTNCFEKRIEWLLHKYEQPKYKLTQFEQDLLQSYLKSSLLSGYEFKSIVILKRMKGKGYFKDIDEDATIEDILADCDITEED